MIIGHVANAEKEVKYYDQKLTNGIQYLAKTDFSQIPEGSYELGEGIFALVQEYTTQPKSQKRPEAHAKYIDIQYMAKGEENIGYSLLTADCVVEEDLLAEKDVVFYSKVADEVDFGLSAGMFAVFYPWDVHRPSVARNKEAKVKKVVVKIPL